MVDRVPLYRADVFTAVAGEGNPAGVVTGADGLSNAAMQAIAAHVGYSETAFLLSARDPSHDVFVRFFTPTREVPVCGHGTLAAQAVRAAERGGAAGRVRQASPGACWDVSWSRDQGLVRASMVQEPVVFGDIVDGALARDVYDALRAERPTLAPPPRVISSGHAKVLVPVGSVAALRALQPDMAALHALAARVGADGWFVFALTGDDDALTECRMFAPSIGIPEDPVNGSGHGPLAAYLVRYGLLAADASGRARFVSRMGECMARPGRVHVTAVVNDDGEVVRVHVGGDVVIAPTTQFFLLPNGEAA